MIATLNQKVYGLAYANHRYENDEYHLSFFQNKMSRDMFYKSYKDMVGTKCIEFEFCVSDLVKGVK